MGQKKRPVCLAETLPGGPEDYLKPTVYSGTGIWSVKNTDPKYRASSVESNNRVQLFFYPSNIKETICHFSLEDVNCITHEQIINRAAMGRARFIIYPKPVVDRADLPLRMCEISWLALAPTAWAP